MIKKILVGMTLSLALVASGLVQAGIKEDSKKIKAMLAKQMPGLKVTEINKTPLKGIYEVIMPPQIIYVSSDANYVISGNLINANTGDNLTLPQRDKVRAQAVDMLGEKSMIVFAPKKTKHTITVFTDIDCGYCRKLHKEVAEYNKLGIAVRYTAFPRAGIGSESYKKAVSVWCASDRKAAMTKAKNGQNVPDKDCKNPVADHYRMGEQLGISGTPALVTESGQVVPGYVPAQRLFNGLEQQRKANKG
ncbi:MAG: DsbC family protein [Gammaproteobacteria bacterium]|nr:DsbC family protein [Gammaproteobacteria bacterium]